MGPKFQTEVLDKYKTRKTVVFGWTLGSSGWVVGGHIRTEDASEAIREPRPDLVDRDQKAKREFDYIYDPTDK